MIEIDNITKIYDSARAVDLVQTAHLLDASGARDIHFGQVIADDVEPDKPQPILDKFWSGSLADGQVTLGELGFDDGAADVNVAAVIILSGDAKNPAEWLAV